MTGPELRYARTMSELEVPPSERTTKFTAALGHAMAIEAILEDALPGASSADVYRIRLAQAVCSSLIGELMPLAQQTPPKSARGQ
jgi:hypothetical protein